MRQENKRGHNGYNSQAPLLKQAPAAFFAAALCLFFPFARAGAAAEETASPPAVAERAQAAPSKAPAQPQEEEQGNRAEAFAIAAVITGTAVSALATAIGNPEAGVIAFSSAALGGGAAVCAEAWASTRRQSKPPVGEDPGPADS